jgi:hypothetical protein
MCNLGDNRQGVLGNKQDYSCVLKRTLFTMQADETTKLSSFTRRILTGCTFAGAALEPRNCAEAFNNTALCEPIE